MTVMLNYDESGELVDGLFFELWVTTDPEMFLPPQQRRPGTVVGEFQGGFDAERHVWGEVVASFSKNRICSANPDHYRDGDALDHRADLFGGDCIPDLVQDNFLLTLVVSKGLGIRLAQSGLSGFSLVDLPIGTNQSLCQNPELFRIEFTGVSCVRDMKVIPPDPNSCPFCGWGPVVCPECGEWEGHCRNCRRGLLALPEEHQGPGDKRFIRVPWSGLILEGRGWDGNDFIPAGQGILSIRAIRWLQEVGARSFVAEPCRMDITGMTASRRRQRRELEAFR